MYLPSCPQPCVDKTKLFKCSHIPTVQCLCSSGQGAKSHLNSRLGSLLCDVHGQFYALVTEPSQMVRFMTAGNLFSPPLNCSHSLQHSSIDRNIHSLAQVTELRELNRLLNGGNILFNNMYFGHRL